MEFGRSSVCACCWERLGSRSKALYSVNEAKEELIRTFIFPGYSSTIKHYQDVVCSGCRRNLYRLKAGGFPSGAWGEKISKVIIRTLFKYLYYIKIYQAYFI